jgi:hypothetical protein
MNEESIKLTFEVEELKQRMRSDRPGSGVTADSTTIDYATSTMPTIRAPQLHLPRASPPVSTSPNEEATSTHARRPSIPANDGSNSSATLRKWYNSFARTSDTPSIVNVSGNDEGIAPSSSLEIPSRGSGLLNGSLSSGRSSSPIPSIASNFVSLFSSTEKPKEAMSLDLDSPTPVMSPSPELSPALPSLPVSLPSSPPPPPPHSVPPSPSKFDRSRQASAFASASNARPTFNSARDFPPEAAYISYDSPSISAVDNTAQSRRSSEDFSSIATTTRRPSTNSIEHDLNLNLNRRRGIHSHVALEGQEVERSIRSPPLNGSPNMSLNATRWQEQTKAKVFPPPPVSSSIAHIRSKSSSERYSSQKRSEERDSGRVSPVMEISRGSRDISRSRSIASSSTRGKEAERLARSTSSASTSTRYNKSPSLNTAGLLARSATTITKPSTSSGSVYSSNVFPTRSRPDKDGTVRSIPTRITTSSLPHSASLDSAKTTSSSSSSSAPSTIYSAVPLPPNVNFEDYNGFSPREEKFALAASSSSRGDTKTKMAEGGLVSPSIKGAVSGNAELDSLILEMSENLFGDEEGIISI